MRIGTRTDWTVRNWPWTVDIYFLLVLQRPDIWPAGDRALAVAVSQAFGLDDVIDRKSLVKIAEPWRPYRSWAARIFWHDYLIRRNRLTIQRVRHLILCSDY